MSKFSEKTFKDWAATGGDHEKKLVKATKLKIDEGIKKHDHLKNKGIGPTVQGSYANDTNVKRGSDIDFYVMLPTHHQTSTQPGQAGGIQFNDFQTWVRKALIHQFGANSVIQGNKSIQVRSNPSQIQADVVPCFQTQVNVNGKMVEAIRFFSNQSLEVVNFPKSHETNGNTKNRGTSKRFKKVVRIFKKIRLQMEKDTVPIPKSISSFLIEGLVYNVPNEVFTRYPGTTETLQNVLTHLMEEVKYPNRLKSWTEVSGCLPLFSKGRKWKAEHVEIYLREMWRYLEF